ncbi:hypothetical protein ES708_13171 [subsurface metagenome]
MGGEALEGLAPLSESALILSGPDDDIFDSIFDWIQSAIYAISRTVASWVSDAWSAISNTIISWVGWVWDSIYPWLKSILDWIRSVRDTVVNWVSTKLGELWSWITASFSNLGVTIGTWFSEQWAKISGHFSTWWTDLTEWWSSLTANFSSYFTDLWLKLEATWDWLIGEIVTRVTEPLAAWWGQFLEKLFDFPAWVGNLMGAVLDWALEDVPGSSPRIWALFESIGDWFWTWVWGLREHWLEDPPSVIPYVIIEQFRWIGDTFNVIFETFMEAIIGLVRQIGPTNPSIAVNSYQAMAKVGMIALGGLAGMTVAGETLNPISHLGLGHISAMIYDMTNYKVITGVFMGALTFAMLRQPLTYYFNDIFRPYILRIGDFMELMARDAFKELSFAPLRYFPLAGIARVGFWDEPWFTEALSRSGYSPTAREALMVMFREQVLTARQLPVMSQIRRLSREGFATMEEIKAHLEKAAAMETLTESRFFAMELEQEFARKEMAFDIMMRAFSRGIDSESEARKGLAGLGIPETMLDLHFMREKLGLLRRISIPTEAAAPALIGVEE